MTPPRRIGGSDLPKLLGISKYGNKMDVYLRIVEGVEDDWNPRMMRGTAAEPVLRAHGQRLLGLELEEVPEYVDSADHEFARAQIDDLAHWRGLPVVVEYKSQSQFAKGWLPPDTVPGSIHAQVAWQLMCADRELALVVVGFGQDTDDGGFDIFNIAHFEVQRDPVFESYCVQVAREFWETSVLRRAPPDLKPLGKKRVAA